MYYNELYLQTDPGSETRPGAVTLVKLVWKTEVNRKLNLHQSLNDVMRETDDDDDDDEPNQSE